MFYRDYGDDKEAREGSKRTSHWSWGGCGEVAVRSGAGVPPQLHLCGAWQLGAALRRVER